MSQTGGNVANEPGFRKLEVFPESVMRWMATQHIPFFKKRVVGGMDGKGQRFKIYTNKYMIAKSDGFKSSRTGKRIPSMKQVSLNTQVFPPNLTLTGLMLKNLKRTGYNKTSWTIGFRGEPAEKAQGNKEQGRNIIDDLPNNEKAFLVKLLAKQMDKQFRKLKDVTITVGK